MKINIRNALLQGAMMVLTYAAPLFIPSGVRAWPAAWIFLVMWFGFNHATLVWLYLHDPRLLVERLQVDSKNRPSWDKIFTPAFYGSIFLWLLFIAFDVTRFHGSSVPAWLQAGGAALLLCSFYILFITFRENTYLSPVVRIQAERGQQVISTGPYHYVRHPMYAAMIFFFLGTPLLLGSWYGIPLGVLEIVILAGRAVLEEGTLRRELSGYSAYMAQVRFRLIPYLW
ncbi:MAG: isoprenylcysteine carboxylmethyltransferase family protein [Anaerolineaceae bacterium]|nr:isoprenylcysteine carboxylmethyltransferase family protein [Anaerolineaceae bacterium]